MDENSLTELVEELSKQVGFDSNRIWIGRNSYDEYEMEIDGELWSNSYTYDETETAIRCLFKGMKLNENGI